MKHTLLSLAGALPLFAMLGRFYGVPFLSHVRAGVIEQVDKKAHVRYRRAGNTFCSPASVCTIHFASVPQNKRLMIEQINAEVISDAASIADVMTLSGATSDAYWTFSGQSMSTGTVALNAPVLAYFDSGQTPVLTIVWGTLTGSGVVNTVVTGYLVDLAQ